MFYNINRYLDTQEPMPQGIGSIEVYNYQRQKDMALPVLHDNMLILGKIGCGKTYLTMRYVQPLLAQHNEPYSIFFDIKNEFCKEWLRPQDKVITYSAHPDYKNMQLFKWNMIKEIKQSDDWEAEINKIVSLLFEDLAEDNHHLLWVNGAKNTFAGFLKTIIYCYNNCPGNKSVINAMRLMTQSQFLEHLARYKDNWSLLRDYFSYDPLHHDNYQMPRKGSDIMFFLQDVLAKFGGLFNSEDGDDTLHDFYHDRYGRRLFLAYDFNHRESLELFYRYFLQRIIDERLSLHVDRQKHVLLVLDEIAEINHDFGLMQGVTLGRANNLQVIVSTQSFEKMYCVAPALSNEHITNAMLSGFPTVVSFMLGDSATIDQMKSLFGEKMQETHVLSMNRYEPSHTKIEMMPIVSERDLATLGQGDCFIKMRQLDPMKIHIKRK